MDENVFEEIFGFEIRDKDSAIYFGRDIIWLQFCFQR